MSYLSDDQIGYVDKALINISKGLLQRELQFLD